MVNFMNQNLNTSILILDSAIFTLFMFLFLKTIFLSLSSHITQLKYQIKTILFKINYSDKNV